MWTNAEALVVQLYDEQIVNAQRSSAIHTLTAALTDAYERGRTERERDGWKAQRIAGDAERGEMQQFLLDTTESLATATEQLATAKEYLKACHGIEDNLARGIEENESLTDQLTAMTRERDIAVGGQNWITCPQGHRFPAPVCHPAKSEREWYCPHCTVDELATAQAENARLREAVVESNDALKAWMHTYASEECDEAEVKRYRDLIQFHNGTLAYLARAFKINKQALTTQEPT